MVTLHALTYIVRRDQIGSQISRFHTANSDVCQSESTMRECALMQVLLLIILWETLVCSADGWQHKAITFTRNKELYNTNIRCVCEFVCMYVYVCVLLCLFLLFWKSKVFGWCARLKVIYFLKKSTIIITTTMKIVTLLR